MSDRSTDKELLEMIKDSSRWVARTIIPQLAREIQTERTRISTLEKARELLQFAVSAHERNLLEHSEANAALERRVGELTELIRRMTKHMRTDLDYTSSEFEDYEACKAGWRAALASTPREGTGDGFTGWVCGPNYRRRGRVLAEVGGIKGEPWYQVDDGTKWSAFDVEFRPDKPTSADPPVDREQVRLEALEKERDALAAALDRVEAALMMRQRKSHHDTCTAELIPGSECDCGFVAAQIALSASIPYALKSHDATIRRQARQAALVEAARWVKDHRYMIPSSEYGSGWNDALDAAEIRLRKMAEAESSD